MEPINEYRLRKLVCEIIFNFDIDDYDEEPYAYDLIFIESLRNIVKARCEKNDLSKDVMNNINKFLSYAREYKDENREKRIELINEIIMIMNSQEKDESLIFYRFQLYERRRNFEYLLKKSDREIIEQIPNIHKSICHDLFVVVSHSNDVSDMDFVKEYLPDLKDSDLYYESLNMMLKENPLVFKDQLFYNRMICVLEYNSLICEDLIKYNEKLVKKIDKKIKKIKLRS